MDRRNILFCFLFLISWGINGREAIAQNQNPTFLGLRGHYGFMLIHSKTLAPIGQPYPWGVEMDLGKQFISQKAWNGCNCYPRAGVSLSYWNFDRPSVLGSAITAVAYMEPVYLTRHRFNISLRWGMGISYQTMPYDEDDNPLNQAYSTRFAFPLAVNLGFYYRLNQQWDIRGAFNYNHISNGGIKLPNKGLNYPTVSLGVDYFLQPVDFVEREKQMDKPAPEDRNRWYFGHFSALSQLNPVVPKQYYVMGFWAKFSRNLGRKSALTGGLEFIHDRARKNEVERWNLGVDYHQLGLLAGHELWLGRVVFAQQLGVYLYDKMDYNDPVYQRYELLYRFHPNVFGGISLKAHRHVADFLDLRIGAVF